MFIYHWWCLTRLMSFSEYIQWMGVRKGQSNKEKLKGIAYSYRRERKREISYIPLRSLAWWLNQTMFFSL